MPERAAIVTGASRGIGLALATVLADEGYGVTLTARKPELLEESARTLRERGAEVQHVAANLADEESVRAVVTRHRETFGRLDVLREQRWRRHRRGGRRARDQASRPPARRERACDRPLLPGVRGAAAGGGRRHRRALVVNMASMAGKSPQPWLSVYSATKAAVVAYTTAMNKELNGEGVKSVAFCPGFVDTDMSEFVKESIPAEEMLRTSDIAEALRFLLRLSPNCVIPEIIFQRPGEAI
jgi:short-subunit dehydrogenase